MNKIYQYLSKTLVYWIQITYTNNELSKSIIAKSDQYHIKISIDSNRKWIKIGSIKDKYQLDIYHIKTGTYIIKKYIDIIDDVIKELDNILITDIKYIKIMREEKLNRILND